MILLIYFVIGAAMGVEFLWSMNRHPDRNDNYWTLVRDDGEWIHYAAFGLLVICWLPLILLAAFNRWKE